MPSYLWPMTSPPPVLARYRLVMSRPWACFTCCSCVRHNLETCLHILPPILGFLWREPFSSFSSFKACSFQGWVFAWPWAFPPSVHSLALFCSLCVFCRTALSFLLWRYLTQSCSAFLGLLLILPSMTQYSYLGFFGYIGILSPFTFLGPF